MTTQALAIIQARMSSSRLPGKVLAPILNLPAIVFMVSRVRQAKRLARIVVATSVDRSDDSLADELASRGIDCFRGDLNDVLDRYYRAAQSAGAQTVVRLTGDCPLMDPDLVDHALALLESSGADYVSNVAEPSFPDGLDVEAFRFEALERAWREASARSDREHVTTFIRNQNNSFACTHWRGGADYSALRWTVDHQDDLDHVRAMLSALGAQSATEFDRFDLYRLCELHPEFGVSRHLRNEGYQASLQADAASRTDS